MFSVFAMFHQSHLTIEFGNSNKMLKCLNKMFPTYPFSMLKFMVFILTQFKSDLLKLRTAVDPRTTLTPGVDLLSV